MAVGEYEWPSAGSVVELRPEREAIRWLLEHVAPPAGHLQASTSDGMTGYDYYQPVV
jgi:hypothetical protein